MSNKFVIALIIFAVWILITLFGPKIQIGSQELKLDDLVARGIAFWLAGACVFLLLCVAILGWWRQVGLRPPEPKSWRLTWFPVLIIIFFLATAILIGLPAGSIVFFVVINTFFVGISEEMMTRGVLLYGSLSRFGIWTSIVIVSVAFGAMHLMNGFITGDFLGAGVQAVAAGMSGVLFIGLRLRSNSLIPGIVVHWLWDCSLFLMGAALAGANPVSESSAPGAPVSLARQVLYPIFMATPTFLYGLWLLRHIGSRNKGEFMGDER